MASSATRFVFAEMVNRAEMGACFRADDVAATDKLSQVFRAVFVAAGTALLNAIRVGFRSALIHRQAGEISKILQKVRKEFEVYGEAVQTAYKRAERTVTAIGKLRTRQNVMGKALRGIDLLSADTPIDAATM